MKYFITDSGLVPFNLTPTELTNILLGDHHNQKQSPDDKNFNLSVDTITQIMDDHYSLFKHPDMSVNKLMVIIEHKENDSTIKNIAVGDYYQLEYDYELIDVIMLITSIENIIYSIRGKQYLYHTIQYLSVDANLFKTWERKLIIDTILNDLPE